MTIRRMIAMILAVLLCFGCAALAEAPEDTWGMLNGMGGTVAYEYDGEGRVTKEIFTEAMTGAVVRTIVHQYYEDGVPIADCSVVYGVGDQKEFYTERMYVDGKYLLYESSLPTGSPNVSSEAEYEMSGAVSFAGVYGDQGRTRSYWVVKYFEDGRADVIEYYHMDGYKFMEFDIQYNEDGSICYVMEKYFGSDKYFLKPEYDDAGRLVLLADANGWMKMNLSYDEAGNVTGVFRDTDYEDLKVEWSYDANGFVTSAVLTNLYCDNVTFTRGSDGLMVQN